MQLEFKKDDFSNDLKCSSPEICPVAGIPLSLREENYHLLHKPITHFLKFFLDVSYYLCIIPYKIVVTVDGVYKRQNFRPQQILCLIVHIAGTLEMLTHLRSAPFKMVSEYPKVYFDIFIKIVHTTVIITFCYTVWTRGKHFCSLVEKVQGCPVISQFTPKRMNWIMFTIIVIYVIIAFLNPIFNEGNDYSWKGLFKLHALRGRYMLFLSGESISTNWNYKQNETKEMLSAYHPVGKNIIHFFQFPDFLFALFSYFASTSQWIIVAHADLIVNAMALTLWCSTSYFIHNLNEQACKNTCRNYEALKILVNLINTIIGPIVLTYTVDSILYYATNLESLFTGKNWFAKVVVLQYLLGSISWLHFASCACLQMEKFREWVRQKDSRTVLPSKSISIILLLDELSTNTVAISGNGLFTVNYKFVAQALTTVMTYFILVIQFKK